MSTSLDLGHASLLSCPIALRSAHVLPATTGRASGHATIAMLARLYLTYWWRHGRILSLDRPRAFTELVQRRKLIDRDPRLPQLIDKFAVKQVIADTLGHDWVTPTLWTGEALPDAPLWPAPFVVKSRHGCKQLRVVCGDADDWATIRRDSAAWMRRPYGRWLDEWGYRDVPRGLLVEPFIGTAPSLPTDYKLYVFHGRVEAVQVHLDRADDHRWMLFDRRWQPMSTRARRDDPVPPATLAQMIEAAEILGRTFDFVRVDFYDIGAVPRFGEMTFYPGSGLDPFDPLELDQVLGRHWSSGGGDTGQETNRG